MLPFKMYLKVLGSIRLIRLPKRILKSSKTVPVRDQVRVGGSIYG